MKPPLWKLLPCLLGWILSIAAHTAIAGVASDPRDTVFLVELRLDSLAVSRDFHEVIRRGNDRLLVPVAALVALGEGVASVDEPLARFENPSTHQSLRVDAAAHTVTVNGERRVLAPDDFAVMDRTLLLERRIVEQAFSVSITLSEESQRLSISTDAPWPVALRLARERRWGRLHTPAATADPSWEVRQDYAAWGAPQADVTLSLTPGHLTHSVLAVGEVAWLTSQVFASGQNGRFGTPRVRVGRSDSEGGVFGIAPLHDLQLGDVQSLRMPLLGRGRDGRGLSFLAQPLDRPTSFDTTRIEGDALPGWDAELVADGNVLDFMRVGADGRYNFDNIPLGYGSNLLRVLLYGPQGQIRESTFRQNVGSEMVPVGEIYSQGYWLKSDLSTAYAPAARTAADSIALTSDVGLSRYLTAGLFLARLPDDAARSNSYTGLRLRATAGSFALGLDQASQSTTGARALQFRAIGDVGGTTVNASHEQYGAGFSSPRNQWGQVQAISNLRFSVPFQPGMPSGTPTRLAAAENSLYISGALDRTVMFSGEQYVAPSIQVSHALRGVSLTHQLAENHWRAAPAANGTAQTPERRDTVYRLLGAANAGPVRLRGNAEWRIAPDPGWSTIALTAFWRDKADFWNASLSGTPGRTLDAGLNWSRDLRWAYLSVGGTWSKQSGVSMNLGLVFTLSGSRRDGLSMSSQNKAMQGQADVRILRQDEQRLTPVAGVGVFVNQAGVSGQTDDDGQLLLGGLAADRATELTLDPNTLPDAFLVPTRPKLRFRPRPGQRIELTMPLVESGEISGRLVGNDERPIGGLRLQAYDTDGRLHAQTTTFNDGYFVFDSVYPGRWQIRVAPEQAPGSPRMEAAPLDVELDAAQLHHGNILWRLHATP